MTATQLKVAMAEIRVQREPASLACLGIGSCIAFCALDPTTGVSAMAHIMLPRAFLDKPLDRPGKFADTAIPTLLEEMQSFGADPARILVAYSGGAQAFRFGREACSQLDVGVRNAAMVEHMVRAQGLATCARDVGGCHGRSITFSSATGEVRVRKVGGAERVLCTLRP